MITRSYDRENYAIVTIDHYNVLDIVRFVVYANANIELLAETIASA